MLTGLIPWENAGVNTAYAVVPGTWELLMQDLIKNRPTVIVDTSPGNYRGYAKYPIHDFPPLDEYIKNYYELSRDIVAGDGRLLFRVLLRREASAPAPRDAPLLEYERKVSFGLSGDSARYKGLGWSGPEPSQTWTEGTRASLAFKPPASKEPVYFKMKMAGMNYGDRLPSQPVEVSLNGVKVAHWDVADDKVYSFPLPRDLSVSPAPLAITFAIPKATSPASLGQGGDARRLGLRCEEMELSSLGTP